MSAAFRFMMTTAGTITLVMFLSVLPAQATVDSEVEVKGSVVSFDETTVKILNQGSVTLAPRSSAPKKLKKGDVIQVSFNLEEFKKTLPTK